MKGHVNAECRGARGKDLGNTNKEEAKLRMVKMEEGGSIFSRNCKRSGGVVGFTGLSKTSND